MMWYIFSDDKLPLIYRDSNKDVTYAVLDVLKDLSDSKVSINS